MIVTPLIELNELDGRNGFALNGINAYDFLGYSVSEAGDVNGDGVDDFIIGGWTAEEIPNGGQPGPSYVVFGGKQVGKSGIVELSNLDGSNGFALNGISGEDFAGRSVSGAGDINADGFADLVIGNPFVDPNGERSGQSYVVFGGRDVGSGGAIELSELDGSNGSALNGINAGDGSGWSVSGAGDVNDDEIDDLLIGAPFADPNGDRSGQSYIVFGQPSAPLPLSNRTALANCLVEAGFAASAAITTSQEDCEDTAGQWQVEVRVPNGNRRSPEEALRCSGTIDR